MDKKLRGEVRMKFNGKCALCGYDIVKGCHIWDIKPIQTVINNSGELEKTNTGIENLIPACSACAGLRRKTEYHGKMDIETFRDEVNSGFNFLRSGGITGSAYGRAIRFKQIIETNRPVIFYFEKMGIKL